MKQKQEEASSFQAIKSFVQKVESEYEARNWEEVDRIEEHNRSIICQNDSDDSQPRRKRKTQRDCRNERRLNDIAEYEVALKKLREGRQQYYNPFRSQKLTLQCMPVLSMLEKAIQKETNLEMVLKKMGLKTTKMLFKCGARNNIKFIHKYLKDGQIPNWILQRHNEMMKKQYRFVEDQNALLRTMSNTANNCQL